MPSLSRSRRCSKNTEQHQAAGPKESPADDSTLTHAFPHLMSQCRFLLSFSSEIEIMNRYDELQTDSTANRGGMRHG